MNAHKHTKKKEKKEKQYINIRRRTIERERERERETVWGSTLASWSSIKPAAQCWYSRGIVSAHTKPNTARGKEVRIDEWEHSRGTEEE